ncbi:hypothetical protein N7468_008900 [Penicillium chermesinum]|uniref:Rhodopsin domain-containing protein n=1 Tax=Penicillium chermesinum TaxID=63820 RepID=A0A9W9TEI0_9EURO|nr:uncharacterized protein N7468_008900 [Penicillium chermesinum]KAJ5219696.1 hypothetical protein N7468_008900 [Penicillium chermesinum]
MAGTLPPLFEITEDDHAGYAAVTAYTLLALTIVVVVTRLAARWFIGRIIYSDDILLGMATLFAILQTVMVQQAMHNGLGRRKYQYVAQILLVVTMAFGKLSLGLLFRSLMATTRYARANWAIIGVVIAWAVSSSFALIFRCDLPTPWNWIDPEHCVNQRMLFEAIGIINITTDAAIAILPCLMLRSLRLSYFKRMRMMLLLSSRVFVCAATGFQIRNTLRMLRAHDPVWATTRVTIWDQVSMNLSIITTAIPSLGRLVMELQPSNFSFPINEGPMDIPSLDGKFQPSSRRSSLSRDLHMRSLNVGTSIHGTQWRDTIMEDDESLDQLVRTPSSQGGIQQTLDFEVH